MNTNFKSWPILLALGLTSVPLVTMYAYMIIDTVTVSPPGSFIPNGISFGSWSFLWEAPAPGRPSIWSVTLNTFIFACVSTLMALSVSLTGGYALSRLHLPFRGFFLGGLIVLHAFPTITLIIAIFLILQMVGLYDTLAGVILVKAALEIPFGVWIMKGFYDTVPWEIEMAGLTDGASRFTVWRKLVLPQVQPGITALGIFAFLSGWSEFILPQVLAPGADAQVLGVYLQSLISDDTSMDFAKFKSVGVFYAIPVILIYILFNKHLMNIYGGGTKG
ncbi:carbohydrate ABC transporter permease [Pseudovibrio sp. SPO723]|uniref:carbohydrate ABC transporter permease n=1 Tax=Nesiotobacter zosterae TaxID=392721 RepID=UPI0029C3C78D|nr:carbohydrate ABC transporter permease [Pseudovibrio sp. SPO723]MDX5595461.1 carbohydrate ABC transporter permease [Pseudovibrio sp. SPO723]